MKIYRARGRRVRETTIFELLSIFRVHYRIAAGGKLQWDTRAGAVPEVRPRWYCRLSYREILLTVRLCSISTNRRAKSWRNRESERQKEKKTWQSRRGCVLRQRCRLNILNAHDPHGHSLLNFSYIYLYINAKLIFFNYPTYARSFVRSKRYFSESDELFTVQIPRDWLFLGNNV